LIVPMSGATGVPFRSFLFYDLLGTLVWAAVPIGSGMIFHEQVDGVLAAMSRVGLWFLLALAVAAAGAIAWRYASRAATQ
jgi:membrane protein DedA with SNARE-associated domain